MTADFRRWEVDPFFAAAEQVQDSVDRLESAYRTCKHLKLLAEISAGDLTAGNLIDFRHRELLTALGTAKWQLEEFERAVKQEASKDQLYTGEDAPIRHAQFVKAIQDQISEIENSLCQLPESEDFKFIPGLARVVEENDELACFLSGPKSTEPAANGDVQISLSNEGGSTKDPLITVDCVKVSKDEACSMPSESMEVNVTSLSEKPSISSDISILVNDISNKPEETSRANQARDIICNGKTDAWMETGYFANSSHLSKSRDNLYIEDERKKKVVGERMSDHRRAASLGSNLNIWKHEGLDKSKLGKHARSESQASNSNGFNNLLGLFNVKYPIGKLRISKSGFKKWKDGDTSYRDCEQMLGYTDARSDSSNHWLPRHTNGSNGPSSDSKQKQFLGWGGSLQKHLQLTHHAFPSSLSVQLASAFLVTLGLVGLLSFHAAF